MQEINNQKSLIDRRFISLKDLDPLKVMLWAYFDPGFYNDVETSNNIPICSYFIEITCVNSVDHPIYKVIVDDHSYKCPKCNKIHPGDTFYISEKLQTLYFFCHLVPRSDYDPFDRRTHSKIPSWEKEEEWMPLNNFSEKEEMDSTFISPHFKTLEEGFDHLLKMCGGNKDKFREIFNKKEQEIPRKDNEKMYWEDFIHDFLKTKTAKDEKSWLATKTIIGILKNSTSLLDSVNDDAISKCISSNLKGFGYGKSILRKYKGKRIRGYKLELL